ncbi:D-2-hydroxyacid dehydrogenase [Devosia sp. 1566]|uniref:D-2-hydroxyacid dehydrogenase n=1 Tax=Devosia sp. 1566 TaxID=2499144 RepID=UPI000FD7BEB9|nr:D-2-hydroxyacid dehydrogenase [Devosia sp. 1566]
MNIKHAPDKLTILIASPLEDQHVERIKAYDPARYEVIHHPDLLARPRYVADHNGAPRTLSEDERARWSELMAQAHILFDFDRLDPSNMPVNAPNLRWVQATSAGIGEFLRRTELDQSNIIFTTASGVHARPLAEFASLGLLYFFRDVPYLDVRKREHHWERYTVRGLEGARALIVGLGSVGREIARDCAHFGVEVWGTRRTGGAAPEGVSRMIDQKDIRQVLPDVDALVLACPLTEETRLLIDKPELDALRPGAVIVNVARGQVINEAAMYEGLRSGRIKGAALDVFETEPLPKENPMWDLPNVLISPHSASTVDAENSRIVDIFIDNLGRFARGEPLRNVYEPERGY